MKSKLKMIDLLFFVAATFPECNGHNKGSEGNRPTFLLTAKVNNNKTY